MFYACLLIVIVLPASASRFTFLCLSVALLMLYTYTYNLRLSGSLCDCPLTHTQAGIYTCVFEDISLYLHSLFALLDSTVYSNGARTRQIQLPYRNTYAQQV